MFEMVVEAHIVDLDLDFPELLAVIDHLMRTAMGD
jgi:hypothetical protein